MTTQSDTRHARPVEDATKGTSKTECHGATGVIREKTEQGRKLRELEEIVLEEDRRHWKQIDPVLLVGKLTIQRLSLGFKSKAQSFRAMRLHM